MRKINVGYLILLGFGMLLVACKEVNSETAVPLEKQISKVRQKYAPDKRVAIFQVDAVRYNNDYVLKGESNLPSAVDELKEKLKLEHISFVDSIQLLPDTALNGMTQGVIRVSVANLRSHPAHSAELATQATLGTPVKIYKKDGSWYLIQTPDHYISWVDHGGLELMSEQEFSRWKSVRKLIFLGTYGNSFAQPNVNSQTVTDLVAGDILEKIGEEGDFYRVSYPDGRMAYIEKSMSKPYEKWLKSINPTEESLVNTSKTLMGLPYLWGGTSPKGVDCSGFTKTIYFLNGMVIPRDASQQIATGQEVDSTKNFEKLRPGDLLFFGKSATDSTEERVVHVGMWIGNDEFIHSSGDVHISSMNKSAPNYDEYNYDRYLRSQRLLNVQDKALVDLSQKDIFKD
ncbi:C40 family peptidase [Flavobacteriaceae bacterium F89]|uniref:C40 family peptidase n=1 Tax=Cerina litoralis TaxID=2874477 RepID=A0AAE3ETE0_9FLAO|nr:NlpC/P60 family protein [Cerina litoralis]MCG2459232.1 C40 family peptidase [Cerina litoralis]